MEAELADKNYLQTVYFEGTPLQRAQPVLYRNKVKLALPRVKKIDASELSCFPPSLFRLFLLLLGEFGLMGWCSVCSRIGSE